MDNVIIARIGAPCNAGMVRGAGKMLLPLPSRYQEF